ncbi:LpxI family protein [Actibacterium sp. XHP0104]|uniref:LpxI family protein n=1 Tax=Actibacterium sp. XHP0104 TaxID=2984335 RepID=UPI0029821847|nr:UDP-2,3-diacylglucosamine diphosphatase LpxI [Actibacterium sp. XHP0104]
MTDSTAIIAGRGALPALLADSLIRQNAPVHIFELDGFPMDNPAGLPVEKFILERLALLFNRMHDLGVARVVFAGAVARAALDPERIDPQTAQLLPRIVPALQQGDDATLRAILQLFVDEGFQIMGAHDVAPDLLPQPGVLTSAQPGEADQADAARADEIVRGIGALDLGQGAVVAGGLCLAVETLPGTDAMLDWVADIAVAKRVGRGGVFLKAPKPGQERRMDLPAIGPGTIERAARAGLNGVVIEAGGVMILDQPATIAMADQHGLFLWVRPA